ncbi:hypothetical protein HDU67_006253 [Dinochytrium kinnereticum]|nr:hypothetical protein HDU67_006253 [Dinochytrium kinnereticum]
MKPTATLLIPLLSICLTLQPDQVTATPILPKFLSWLKNKLTLQRDFSPELAEAIRASQAQGSFSDDDARALETVLKVDEVVSGEGPAVEGVGVGLVEDVRFCPKLKPRETPAASVWDLRVDDIKTVLGVGDSIMAGFGSRINDKKQILSNNPLLEYRGANFATGGDDDSKSVGNLIKHYSPSVRGLSQGTRVFNFCYGPICPSTAFIKDNVPVQGLNAAESGAWTKNWPNQMGYFRDHLTTVNPTALTDPTDFKLMMVVLGYNDLCLGCTDWSSSLVFEADKYEKNLRDLLLSIRQSIPNVLVSVLSPFKLSQITPLTDTSGHCKVLRKLLFVECLCLNEEGKRRRMDEMAAHYFERTKKVARELNEERDPGFAVSFDPGMAGLNVTEGRVKELLSQLDCFHPSKSAHDLIATSMWNNFFLPQSQRPAYNINQRGIVCPTEDMRIRVD